MGNIQVQAGDFLKNDGSTFMLGTFLLYTEQSGRKGETISATEIEFVEVATEENVKKIGGTVGWGVAGAVLLGPAGMLAGLLLGGRKKKVTFIVKFKDGRKLLATTPGKTFAKIQAASF